MTSPLMSRVKEAASEIASARQSDGSSGNLYNDTLDDSMALAQFLLTELSRAGGENDRPRKVWVYVDQAGYLLNLPPSYTEVGNEQCLYVPESLLIAARASHAVEVERLQKTMNCLSEMVDERDIALGKSGIEQQLAAEREARAKAEAALAFAKNEAFVWGERLLMCVANERYAERERTSELEKRLQISADALEATMGQLRAEKKKGTKLREALTFYKALEEPFGNGTMVKVRSVYARPTPAERTLAETEKYE